MKRYALLVSLVLCGIVLAFEGKAGKVNVAGDAVNTNTGANDGRAVSNSSTASRISKPGEYTGYSDAIYDDKYELTSQYVQVSDGTKLAMDLYRPRDKATGKVIDAKLPVLWMHTPYNRRYSNDKTLTGEGYPGTAAKLVKYGYVVAIVDFRGLYASYGHNVAFNRGEWLTAARRDAYDITEWLAQATMEQWQYRHVGLFGHWRQSATGCDHCASPPEGDIPDELRVRRLFVSCTRWHGASQKFWGQRSDPRCSPAKNLAMLQQNRLTAIPTDHS